jgi:hypothetical protein
MLEVFLCCYCMFLYCVSPMIVDRICWILVHLFLYCIELEAEHVDGGEFNVKDLLNMKEFTNAYALLWSCCCCSPRRESRDDVWRRGGAWCAAATR